jgi:DNA-directed RNA polymerase II subunit RPB2
MTLEGNVQTSKVVTEMERDCVASHGIAEFTKERFMECSDGFNCWVCKLCGLIAIANPKEGIWTCKNCDNHSEFSSIQIPYASKLFLQELESMCLTSRLITSSVLTKGGHPFKTIQEEHES